MVPPFMPWMGSKRRLLPQLLTLLPPTYRAYHEPFLGSGALLYALEPQVAYASDRLNSVVALHKAVAEDTDDVVARYAAVAMGADRKETFLDIRSRYPDVHPAEFLFLIRFCHGSRYRVNSSGGFNCPFKSSGNITPSKRAVENDVAKIRKTAEFSRKGGTTFTNEDANEALQKVRTGDFVFLDPPYQWEEGKESDYGEKFGMKGWKDLMATLARLPKGTAVAVTLHGSMAEGDVRELAAAVPGLDRLIPLHFPGSHIYRGGPDHRKEWFLCNYDVGA